MFDAYSIVENHLGDYRLKAVLPTSSPCLLYLAEKDSLPGHIFLIKRRNFKLETRREQKAFLSRVDVVKAFSHPFVLPLLDAGFDQATPYTVTTFAKNGSLDDLLKRKPSQRLPLEEAYELLMCIGEALYTAHQKDIIHGNIKTQNILFTAQNEALLADFLLLQSLPPDKIAQSFINDVSRDRVAKQRSNADDGKEVPLQLPSKESDQYALGAVAYELFTGQPPFTVRSKSDPYKTYKVRTLIAPRQLNPGLDPLFEQIVLKTLAKDVTQRYNTIRAFLDALSSAYTILRQNMYILPPDDKNTPLPLWNEAIAQIADLQRMPLQPVQVSVEDRAGKLFRQEKGEKRQEELLFRVLLTEQKLSVGIRLIRQKLAVGIARDSQKLSVGIVPSRQKPHVDILPTRQELLARLLSMRTGLLSVVAFIKTALLVVISFSKLRVEAGIAFSRRKLRLWVLPDAQRLLAEILASGRKLLITPLSMRQRFRVGSLPRRSKNLYKGLFLVILLFVLVLFVTVYSIYHTSVPAQPRTAINIPVQIKPTVSPVITKSAVPTPSPTRVATRIPQPAVIPPSIPTPTPQPFSACSVAYNIDRSMFNQFSASITITNTGTTDINGWSLSWTYADGQSIYDASGAQYQQDGAQVTLQNLASNQIIQPGQQVDNITIAGFVPEFRRAHNSNPTNFILNGMQCG